MFVKLALSFDSLNKSRVESRNLGLWQQRHWEEKKKKKINMISAFLLGFITLPIPGEPELRRGVNSYQVRKNTLTETYPSSPR